MTSSPRDSIWFKNLLPDIYQLMSSMKACNVLRSEYNASYSLALDVLQLYMPQNRIEC